MPERRVYIDAALCLASLAASYYGFTVLMDQLGEDGKRSRLLRSKGNKVVETLGHKGLELDDYEAQLASEIIHPSSLTTTFTDIGGLDPIITSLRETIIYPLVYPDLFSHGNALGGAPKGVLLYGPPGCGKTMMAKALAKESGATFVNVKISSLTNKWFGESNKLIAGLFTLARKLQPSIIFIDEIDAFLRIRSSSDHEVTAMMKAEFMTLWDGLLSSSDRIIVLGATNRPDDIDPAITRRMPKRFAVPMPSFDSRMAILKLLLAETPLSPHFPLPILASRTNGLSGSDLKELCRNAVMQPVREYMRTHDGVESMVKARQEGYKLRPLTLNDFEISLGDLKEGSQSEIMARDVMPGCLD